MALHPYSLLVPYLILYRGRRQSFIYLLDVYSLLGIVLGLSRCYHNNIQGIAMAECVCVCVVFKQCLLSDEKLLLWITPYVKV